MTKTQIAFRIATTIMAMGLLGIIVYKLPVLEILLGFALFVVIPLAMLASVGVIGQSTLDLVRGGAGSFRAAIDAQLAELKKKAREAHLDESLEWEGKTSAKA